MIDETLSRLSRALIVASDKLASEDFLKRQARFVEIEAERAALAESLEADEAAVVAAQEALQAHFRGSDGVSPSVSETVLFRRTESEPQNVPMGLAETGEWIFGQTPSDEFSSSRANGAYTED